MTLPTAYCTRKADRSGTGRPSASSTARALRPGRPAAPQMEGLLHRNLYLARLDLLSLGEARFEDALAILGLHPGGLHGNVARERPHEVAKPALDPDAVEPLNLVLLLTLAATVRLFKESVDALPQDREVTA